MKFYYVALQYNGTGFNGVQRTILSCGVSKRHPFKVLSSIRDEEKEAGKIQRKMARGLALGLADPMGRSELISWQEISEEEYNLALGLACGTGVCDFDAGGSGDG